MKFRLDRFFIALFPLIIFLVVFILIVTGLSNGVSFKTYQLDMLQYWSAAKAFIAGQDAYAIKQLDYYQQTVEVGEYKKYLPMPLFCPFTVFIIIWPLGFIKYASLLDFWLFSGALAISLAFLFLLRFDELKVLISKIQESDICLLATTFIIFLISFWPLSLGFEWGNISTIIPAILLSYLYAENKNSCVKGFLLALLTIKIHMFYIFIVDRLYIMKKEREWKSIYVFMLTISTSFLLLALLNSQSVISYIEIMSIPIDKWKTSSMTTSIHLATGLNIKGILIAQVISGLLVWNFLLKKIKLTFYRTFLLLIPTSILFSPYLWIHDLVSALPSIFVLLLISIKAFTRILYLRFVTGLLLLNTALLYSTKFIVEGCEYFNSKHNCSFGSSSEAFVWYPISICIIMQILFFVLVKGGKLEKQ